MVHHEGTGTKKERVKIVEGEKQYALFKKYTRKWLHKKTGFSLEYLSRLATGRARMNPSFIERVCFKLNKSEEELFRKI